MIDALMSGFFDFALLLMGFTLGILFAYARISSGLAKKRNGLTKGIMNGFENGHIDVQECHKQINFIEYLVRIP